MGETKKALIERLFAVHRSTLQAFFYRRIRHQADAKDLAQEVYVRMLRVKDPESIRDMEAYLFTVASNLAKEHAARQGRRGPTLNVEDSPALDELAETVALDAEIDTARQVKWLREVLKELPPRWHAAVVLRYSQDLSREEIADRMGVSPAMVKKDLAKALGRCRRRMAGLLG